MTYRENLDWAGLFLTVAGPLVSTIPILLRRLWARRELRDFGHKEDIIVTSRALKEVDADQPKEVVAYLSMRPRNASALVLFTFSVAVALFAILAVWRYWRQVATLGDALFLAGGLLLMMVGGMFVQVITTNYTESKSLLQVSAAQLIFPLLFSPIVFYPIWLVGEKQGAQVFSFYAAFLNGYFWQSVVSQIKRPPQGP